VERGLVLNALAARAGISASYLSEVERGYKRPGTDVLARLAEALGMAPSELMAYVEVSGQGPDVVASDDVARLRIPARASRVPPRRLLESAVSYQPEPAAREAVAPEAAEASSPRDRSLRALTRMARALPERDVQLLLELARRLLERRGPGP
jgi:transcriptional regulator with XRE-family HTH domain